MPLLCVKCNTRVHGSLTKETYYCPNCDKELERKDTYKVGKRFFQSEEKVVKLEKIRQKRKKLSGLRKKIWKRS